PFALLEDIQQATKEIGVATEAVRLFSQEESQEKASSNLNRTIHVAWPILRLMLSKHISLKKEIGDETSDFQVTGGNGLWLQILLAMATLCKRALPQGGELRISLDYRPISSGTKIKPGEKSDMVALILEAWPDGERNKLPIQQPEEEATATAL